jgi:uncharacterized protein YndB with AHSA1/START domain
VSLLKKIVGYGLGLIGFLVLGSFLLPSHVHVERDIVINAPPEAVYALVSDFQAWDAWSPWANLDPDAEMTITGTGIGQTMTWASENPQVGRGSQVIAAMDAPHTLTTHLDFGNMGLADATFTLTPEGEQTQVTWTLDTDMRAGVPLLQQPLNTYFGFLMDSMVGKDYETGLQNLKTVVEG